MSKLLYKILKICNDATTPVIVRKNNTATAEKLKDDERRKIKEDNERKQTPKKRSKNLNRYGAGTKRV